MPTRSAGLPFATSSTDDAVGPDVHSTPSSTSCHVARAVMLAMPRHSNPDTTMTGKAGRDHRLHVAGMRAEIQ